MGDKIFNSEKLKRNDLVHPDLSYQIIGCAYEVIDELGAGHPEKAYQRALSISFAKKNLSVEEQVYYPLKFQLKVVEKNFLDFVINDLVVVEIKKNTRFSKAHIDQVNEYLRVSGLKLALLINFSTDRIVFKRIINI